MTIDIEYLLLLQRLRNNTIDTLTPFMEYISLFTDKYIIMIPVLVYWVIGKRDGLYILVSYYVCSGLNVMVKLTTCVYRPWIKDSRVLPAGDAITKTSGYSFPSSHTVRAGTVYGALAVISWSWKKFFSIIFILLILITGFSRNYLGVHTPQDVLMGLGESLLVIFIIRKLFQYLTKSPEKENIFLIASFIIGWLGIVYITFKPYPKDYNEETGKPLVSQKKIMKDGYSDICFLIAFPVARYIEKTWIKFKSTGLKEFKWCISIIGLIPLFIMICYLKKSLVNLLGSQWGHFTKNFIIVFYYVAFFPLIIKLTTVEKPETRIETYDEELNDLSIPCQNEMIITVNHNERNDK